MSRRTDRINELLRQEISQLLVRHIKDPRLSGVITITEVNTSGDLRNALVLLSVMGDEEAKRNALKGIESAATFLRRELRDRLALRYVPFFRFALDDSMEHGDRLLQIMNRIPDNQPDDQDESPLEERPGNRLSADGYRNYVQ
ncbi:MAG: ribosome-binding factor A [SAR202 cluster bacterium Io17-Chloro-G9]|nr:MAG: ribosome-binding factor A [SAR202 cluster bacterium Io17-Chloro-G9]